MADKASVAAAALVVLDRDGLAELSMRHVAAELGVKAPTIYYHYPNKASLLAAVADIILGDCTAMPDSSWGLALREWMDGLRATLLTHRDAAELVSAASASGLMTARPAAGAIELLQREGWSELDAKWSAAAMVRFVLGHVAEEQARVNLVADGTLPPETDPLDPQAFSHGVRLLLAGTANVLP
jgi:AcrR family transcriptional regulator